MITVEDDAPNDFNAAIATDELWLLVSCQRPDLPQNEKDEVRLLLSLAPSQHVCPVPSPDIVINTKRINCDHLITFEKRVRIT